MSGYTSTSHASTAGARRAKSRGWAAFDHSVKQKQAFRDAVHEDGYPPITTSVDAPQSFELWSRNSDFSKRPFSSVIKPSINSPSVAERGDRVELTNFGILQEIKLVEKDHAKACKKLKELHVWADNNLIEDVLSAVEGDIIRASSLLKGMEPTSSEEMMEMKTEKQNTEKTHSFEETADIAANISDLSSSIENALKFDQQGSRDVGASWEPICHDAAAANMKLILGHLKSIPVEPEWEEDDDIYLSHRKNALRVMRTASQHSRAATNAFLRGDHSSAQQHSSKAREEWLAAERLNSDAAREILRVRNSSDDPWKLDLHGLHKAEATQALQEHLHKIEAQLSTDRPIYQNNVNVKSRYSSMISEDRDNQKTIRRGRSRPLQVITGVGNHSRGEAALPEAVRSFLEDNGYHYDETRPGVITVWPKFRRY